jgi:hypothetical protein
LQSARHQAGTINARFSDAAAEVSPGLAQRLHQLPFVVATGFTWQTQLRFEPEDDLPRRRQALAFALWQRRKFERVQGESLIK